MGINREQKTRQSPIYCIGDSHVSFFSGIDWIQPLWPEKSDDVYPFFKSIRLGAVLAYNLCKTGTRWRGRERLFEFLKIKNPADGKIMLSFGEIDCRAHLVKQATLQHRSIDSVVRECVERYFSVVREVKDKGYDVLIWNAIPSTRHDKIPDIEAPVYGTCLERNYATRVFNEYVQELCSVAGIRFLSVFDELVNEEGLTRTEYYLDAVHLSQKAMSIALEKIKELVPEINFAVSLGSQIKQPIYSAKKRVVSKIQRTIWGEE
jgi:lysophospholipase L1-like esterase